MIAGLYVEEHGPDAGEHGPAEAIPVILSSGLGGGAGYWTPNLAALSRRHRVILYDHRGTGRSDRALPRNLTVDDMADDVLALIDGLGLERAHLVGHAAGGVIGLALAARAPERLASLVVVNGWSRLDPHFARCFETRLALLRDSGVHAYLRAQPIFLYPAAWASEHREALDRDCEHQLASFPGAEAVETRVAALQAFRLDDEGLGEIATPVLALAAKDDMLVPWTCTPAYAGCLANARVELVDYGGHACNIVDPATFDRILSAWLAAAPKQGA